MLTRSWPLVASLLLSMCITSSALAAAFDDFVCITGNSSEDCSIGEAQLSASVVASGGNAVLTITMTGDEAAVVERVFIESSIVSQIEFQGSVGTGIVAFTGGRDGGNLPGGRNVGFETAVHIGGKNPKPRYGIGVHPQDDPSGQAAEFLLTLTGGQFADLIADLRLGVHVLGFDSGGSESFVTRPVPEPATLGLLACGLVVAARLGVRRA